MTSDDYGFDRGEEYLYIKPYMFVKGFAVARGMTATLGALPLARRIHDGQHRKGETVVDGRAVKLPYVLHVLKVTSTLLSLPLSFDNAELDIMATAALLHDSIEDGRDFLGEDGHRLVTAYGVPEEAYRIISLLSKHTGASPEELSAYFKQIRGDRLALLIKLSDRSHNVEDLYNMKPEKLHKYVKETRDYIYPMTSYAKDRYPELSPAVTILKSKIVSLTELTEAMIGIYEGKLKEKDDKINELERRVLATPPDEELDQIPSDDRYKEEEK